MFVARRCITQTGPGGIVIRHAPGAVLADFASWDNDVQHVLLQYGDVERVDGGSEADKAPPAVPKAAYDAPDGPLQDFACQLCGGRAFASRQALRMHHTRSHKYQGDT